MNSPSPNQGKLPTRAATAPGRRAQNIDSDDLPKILLQNKTINISQFQAARKKAIQDKTTTLQVLINEGTVTQSTVTEIIAKHSSIPFISNILAQGTIPQNVIDLIPDRIALENKIIPRAYDDTTGTLSVIFNVNNFKSLELRDLIRRSANAKKVTVTLASLEDIERTIPRVFRAESKMEELVADSSTLDLKEEPKDSDEDNFEIDDESSVVQFVKILLNQAITDKASDIHIEPQEHELRIRFRIDGVLHVQQRIPMRIYNEIIARIKILSDMDTAVKNRPQDGRLSVNHTTRGLMDMRVAALPTVYGEKIVLRILDNSQASLSLNQLGFSDTNLTRFRSGYTKPYGMILVTGPTGSGKSTTLYAALNEINNDSLNIITVENPVEYKIPGINQVQVNVKQGMTFAQALRSILRSDPDVILIGEIRDTETAEIAIESGQTGHLVLSTLHTNTSSQAITRLAEMGIKPFLVGAVVEAILAQRLVRRLCKHCRQEYQPDSTELTSIDFPHDPDNIPTLYRANPKGCFECSNSGYTGRMGVHEVLLIDHDVEKLAVQGASPAAIEAYAIENQGMITLLQDGWEKVRQHQTSIEEILRVVSG